MAFSALAHGTLSFCDPVAAVPQLCARVGQHKEGSRGCVEFKSIDIFHRTVYFNREDRPSKWWLPAQEWTKDSRKGQCQCSSKPILPDKTMPSISQPSSVGAQRPLFSPTKTYIETDLTPKDKLWVIAATTRNDLFAAATLRAQIFYTYPQVESSIQGTEAIKARVANDFAVIDLLKRRVKSEYDRESKYESLGGRVKCLLAVCRQSTIETFGGSTATSSHLKPPSISSEELCSTEPLVAIGTLDVQDGTGTKASADVNLVTFQLYALANSAQQSKKQVSVRASDLILCNLNLASKSRIPLVSTFRQS
uniref:Uncharacterized protein n=1 Tax=Physcomitrium patens TaxID=3218 RepID=A0A7I4FSV3_PHYPA